jgi:hypothetical protein
MISSEDRSYPVEKKNVDAGKVKCSRCNRELKFSYQWIGDRQDALCEGCYQSLVFPFLNDSCGLKQN